MTAICAAIQIHAGCDFSLNVVNNCEPNNYRGMVCLVITSEEYQLGFGSVLRHLPSLPTSYVNRERVLLAVCVHNHILDQHDTAGNGAA